MRIKKSTVFLTMFVLLLAFTGCQNESSSTDENKQTKSTASDKVIYNQKDLQNPQKLEISEDGTVEMEIKSMTEPDNILPENKSIFLSITSKKDTDVSLQYTYDTYGKEGALFCCELKEKNGVKTTLEPLSSFYLSQTSEENYKETWLTNGVFLKKGENVFYLNGKCFIYLNDDEYGRVIQSLIRLKNSLIAQGRYTDGVDNVLCKVMSAKKRKLKIKYF